MASTLTSLAAAYSSSSSSSSSHSAPRLGGSPHPPSSPPGHRAADGNEPAGGGDGSRAASSSTADSGDGPHGGVADANAAPIKILRVSAVSLPSSSPLAAKPVAHDAGADADAVAAGPGEEGCTSLGRFGLPGGFDELMPVRPTAVPDLAPLVRRAVAVAAASPPSGKRRRGGGGGGSSGGGGGSFVGAIKARRAFANPSILEKMVAYCGVDVTASAAARTHYRADLGAFDERETAAALVGRQRWHAEATAAAKAAAADAAAADAADADADADADAHGDSERGGGR